MNKRATYIGGICDPERAETCSKDHCYYEGKGDCMHTTRQDWMKRKVKKCKLKKLEK